MVQEAIRRGEPQPLARQIYVRLTTDDPANAQAWLGLAYTAESLEERITALNHVLELDQANTIARQALYETMQHLLRKDAFLAYQGETNAFYQISTLAEFHFAHPKDRAVVEPFPPSELPSTRTAFRWLGWAVIGLVPAGLGTLVYAPLAMLAAIRLLHQHPASVDRRRAWVVLWSAIVLWLIALSFIFILILLFSI